MCPAGDTQISFLDKTLRSKRLSASPHAKLGRDTRQQITQCQVHRANKLLKVDSRDTDIQRHKVSASKRFWASYWQAFDIRTKRTNSHLSGSLFTLFSWSLRSGSEWFGTQQQWKQCSITALKFHFHYAAPLISVLASNSSLNWTVGFLALFL